MGPEWMVIFGALGTLLVGVAGSMAAAARRPTPHQDAAQGAWREAALALDGELAVQQRGALSPRGLQITADIDGARVRLSTNVPVEPTAGASSRAVGRYALGAGPSFGLSTRGLGEAPGDVAVLGDPSLSGHLRLVTDAPDAVARAFDVDARRELAALRRRLHLAADGRRLVLEWDGAEADPAALAAAARLVARVSLVGVGTLREVADLEGARLRASDEGPAVEVERRHVLVTFRGSAAHGGPVYVARAAPLRDLPELTAQIDEAGVIDGEVPPGLLDGDTAAGLARVGASHLRCGPARVELTWDAPPSRARAEAGIQLVAAIAAGTGSQGAFR